MSKKSGSSNGGVNGGGASSGAKAPKRIAGVKVPKELRGSASTFADLTKNPVVGELITTAIVAATAALANNQKVRQAASRAGGEAMQTATEAGQQVQQTTQLLKKAAIDIARSMLDAFEASSIGEGRKKPEPARPTTPPREPNDAGAAI